MYGLPWGLTVYRGVQGAEHYQAAALGLGWSLGRLGAVSLDTTHSRGSRRDMIMRPVTPGVSVITSRLS